jgi:hypothetical protein
MFDDDGPGWDKVGGEISCASIVRLGSHFCRKVSASKTILYPTMSFFHLLAQLYLKYPQIKKKLKPVASDDGIFWVTKEEFFRFFPNLYLSASNMTRFVVEC